MINLLILLFPFFYSKVFIYRGKENRNWLVLPVLWMDDYGWNWKHTAGSCNETSLSSLWLILTWQTRWYTASWSLAGPYVPYKFCVCCCWSFKHLEILLFTYERKSKRRGNDDNTISIALIGFDFITFCGDLILHLRRSSRLCNIWKHGAWVEFVLNLNLFDGIVVN